MLKTLESVTDRIARRYDPLSVVLFGSYANGTEDSGSDVDLLVIKETDKRPIDRSLEIESILGDRTLPLDIVIYTPNEILQLYQQGSSFIEEITTNGKVLYMRKNTELWMSDAGEEIKSAAVLLEHNLYKASCYHSQRAAEKALKAMLIEGGKTLKRTHDIMSLKNEVSESVSKNVSIDDAIFLNSIYKGRYPTEQGLLPHGEPTIGDGERALKAARSVLSIVESSLSIDETNSSGHQEIE